jgi:hypothetical protein
MQSEFGKRPYDTAHCMKLTVGALAESSIALRRRWRCVVDRAASPMSEGEPPFVLPTYGGER